MKRIFLLMALIGCISAAAQPNMMYEVNDYVPPKFLDPKLLFGDSTHINAISYFASVVGVAFDYYGDLRSSANNFNLSVWSNTSYYYRRLQFSFKPTFYPIDNNFGINTTKSIEINNNYDRLKAGLVDQYEFRPRLQLGVYPFVLRTKFITTQLRIQGSWTPVIGKTSTNNEYEFTLGTKNDYHTTQFSNIGQYYVTIDPKYNIFCYGYFSTGTFIKLKETEIDYILNYNRYNRAGWDRNGFIYVGLSTHVYTIAGSKIFFELAYSYDYHYNYRLFHFGIYGQTVAFSRFRVHQSNRYGYAPEK